MVTLTGSLLDAGQGVLDPKRTRVRIESNASTLGAFDAAGHLHLGGEDAAVSADGSFEFTDLVSTADIDGLAYQVHVDYPTVLGNGRGSWASGWFGLTADATLKTVSSVATPQAVPITSLEASIDTAASNVRADTLTAATNAQNSATAAATSETNAASSATAAATSETNAATSATDAADSAAAAAASAAPATSLIRSTVSGDISTDGTDIATQLDARTAQQMEENGSSLAAATDSRIASLVPTDSGSATSAALTTTFVALPGLASYAVEALPTFLYSAVEANAVMFARSNVLTLANGTQYAVWWNAGLRAVVGKRTIGGAWSTYELNNVPGNPIAGPLVNDGHCCLTIARDANGYLHIAGNMHDFALRYIRSTNPDDITAWAAVGMVGTEETSVTYPQFVTAPDGELLFIHRNGTSIAGDLYLNAYNPTAGTWTRRAHLLTGTAISGTAENGYIDQPMIDPATGRIGLFMVWRAGSSFLTTHDICYIESHDNGATWTSIDGAALTLPICPPGSTGGTGSQAPVAFAHPQNNGQGLINQCGAVFDAQGRPHTARWLYDQTDKSIYRLHHYWHDATGWHDEVIRTETGMTVSNTGTIAVPRPGLFTAPNGRTFVIWRNTMLAPQTMWAQDVTPGVTRFAPFPLANVDLGGYEASFDYDAMLAGQLHMLVTPTFRDPNQVPGDENWFGQWGAIVSVDLNQIDLLAAGQVPVLGMEYARNAVTTVASTSATVRADGAKVPVAETVREVLLARVTGNPKATTAAGDIALEQRAANKDTGVQLGSVAPAVGARAAVATPFLPLRPDIEDISAGAVLLDRHAAGAGGTLDVPALGVEVARLRVGSKPLAYTGPRGGTFDKLGRLAAYWNISGAGLADSASIATVNDSSGKGRSLTPQATAPTYKTAGINGAGAIRFASNAALKTAAFAVGNEYTIVTVASSDATPATPDEQGILNAWDSAVATPLIAQLRFDAAGAANGAPPSISALSRTTTSGTNTVTANITTPATPRLIAVRRYWSSYAFIYELWINGALVTAHSLTPSGANPGATGAAPWYMGGRFSGGAMTEYLGGYVGDTVIWDQYLNNAEFRAAQARVARTYGLTLP